VLAERVNALLADRSGWWATSAAARRYFTADHNLTAVVAVLAGLLGQAVAAPRTERAHDRT
jgi:hypothetical protein